MEKDDQQLHVETDEVRGAETPNIARWVLGVSLLLAVVALSIIWIVPALA